jgi:hypothetical protein
LEIKNKFVILTLSKVLRHGNKKKSRFICISHNLFIPLQQEE